MLSGGNSLYSTGALPVPSGFTDHQLKNHISNKMLVASSFNATKKDFRNPFLKRVGTFGNVDGKINRNAFEREYKGEFTGKFSPPPTKYNHANSDFSMAVHDSKSQSRVERVCPIVSKH